MTEEARPAKSAVANTLNLPINSLRVERSQSQNGSLFRIKRRVELDTGSLYAYV